MMIVATMMTMMVMMTMMTTITMMTDHPGSLGLNHNPLPRDHTGGSLSSTPTPGEIKKMEKPFPCTVSWNYKGENESVMNM